jgi:thioredoxin-dependent peroxiredoxin
MSARISVGNPAPAIAERALDGTDIHVPEGGRWTLLSFLRYGSCPMCNLRMRELAARLPELETSGIEVVIVLHSPEARALRYAPQTLRSHVIADPTRHLYVRYGVTPSWAKLLWSFVLPSFYLAFVKATVLRFWGGPIDGTYAMIPADFLIAPDGRVRLARYGKHIGDHASVPDVIDMTLEPVATSAASSS